MLRWHYLALVYAVVGAFSAGLVLALRQASPFSLPSPWLTFSSPSSAHAVSLGLGLILGLATAVFTRWAVPRFRWACELHVELRPFALGITPGGSAGIAFFSSLGEELLFRGLLQPWLGLSLQAAVFGVLHQTTGRSRWVWAVWATLAGLTLGSLFQLTGSLLGCILAHAVINFLNLDYLRKHDPTPERRALGGLLGSSG